jgi:hypothetical protein
MNGTSRCNPNRYFPLGRGVHYATHSTGTCSIHANVKLFVLLLFWGVDRVWVPLADILNTSNMNTLRKFLCYHFLLATVVVERGRDSSVGIETGYGLDDSGVGVRVSVGSRILSSPRRPDRLWGPPSLRSKGFRGFSPGVKRLECEADHPLPTSVEVKKTCIYTSTPPYVFMAQCLIS